MKCSICFNDIEVQPSGWNQGNNAQPVNSGRCCNVCDSSVVIPASCLLYTSPSPRD